MRQSRVSALRRTHRREDDLHVELAPSLLFDRERWCFDDYITSSATCTRHKTHALTLPHPLRPETLMQHICGLLEAVRRHLFAIGAHEVDGDVP